MNKRLKGLLVLLCASALVCCVMVFVIIPRTAALTLPYRWGNIPLGQPRTLLRQYLGKPADTLTQNMDAWVAKRENGEYLLNVTYNSDSSSTGYMLYFNYHLSFFHKQYLLVQK